MDRSSKLKSSFPLFQATNTVHFWSRARWFPLLAFGVHRCVVMQVYTIGCWLSWRIDDKLYSRTAYRRRSVKCETLPLTRTNMFRIVSISMPSGLRSRNNYQWRRRHHHKMSSLDLWHPHFVSPATFHWDCRDVWRCVVENKKYEHSWVIMNLCISLLWRQHVFSSFLLHHIFLIFHHSKQLAECSSKHGHLVCIGDLSGSWSFQGTCLRASGTKKEVKFFCCLDMADALFCCWDVPKKMIFLVAFVTGNQWSKPDPKGFFPGWL